jgi:hypothetical protein
MMDRDTAAFALDRVLHWWQSVGKWVYPHAGQLLITAGFGGIDAPQVRLSKPQLQELADATGLSIALCHLPPGASKWNGVEHRLFSVPDQNGRSKSLLKYEFIVHLIAPASDSDALKVHATVNQDPSPEPPPRDPGRGAARRLEFAE